MWGFFPMSAVIDQAIKLTMIFVRYVQYSRSVFLKKQMFAC